MNPQAMARAQAAFAEQQRLQAGVRLGRATQSEIDAYVGLTRELGLGSPLKKDDFGRPIDRRTTR